MANELTPNLGIEMPDVNDDENTWGDILREAMLAFDAAIAGRVTLSTSQTITGYKRFTGGLSLGTGPGSLNFGMVGARTYFAPRLANDSDWDWSSEFGYDGSKWYAEGPAAVTGEFGALRIRLSSTADVTGTSTDHAFQIGPSNGLNLRIDQNEVSAYSDGQPSALHLNPDGGDVIVGLSYKAWHAGNDGVGSGLDADLLDGQQGSYYANIVARLGYTPMDVAGGAFTGPVHAQQGLQVGTGGGRLNINSSGTRSYFAPRNSNNTDWDWNKEFGYDSSGGYWYAEGPAAVTGEFSALRVRLSSAGNAGTPAFSFSGDDNTGFYNPAANTLAISTAGAERFRVDNSGATVTSGSLKVGSSTVWHSGNDGPGSGLNADTVDGLHGSAFAKLGSEQTFTARNAFSGDYTLVTQAMRFGTFDLAPSMVEVNRGGSKFYAAPVTGSDLNFNREFGFVGSAWFFEGDGDGDILRWERSGTVQGTVSVSGSTVAYGSFCGYHWSQLDQGIVDLPVGTVLSTIDQMCEWFHLEYTTISSNGTPMVWRDVYFGTEPEGAQIEVTRDDQTVMATVRREDNDQLVMVKVSDVPNDTRVYGIFGQWDQDGDATVHGLGATMIRVTGPCEGGDLLASRGDGTAMVQADDIVRSYTIGKVTMGFPSAGADEENLVPCVLYCG